MELAAELAEGWEPIFYYPEKAAQVWGGPLAAGRGPPRPVAAAAGRGRARRRWPSATDVAGYLDLAPAVLALYIGGMGPHRDKGRNFYYELAVRYGFEEEAAADPGRLPGRPQGRGGRAGARPSCSPGPR